MLLWMAQDEDGLNIFRNKGDLYCDMASSIYGRKIEKEKHPAERALGKVAVLGLGYQMGAPKFKATCDTNPELIANNVIVSEELSQQVVEAYRAKYFRVKKLWYDMETAAGEATMSKHGEVFECFPVKWWKEERFLYCELPSGRRLSYPDAKIKMITTSWGARKNAITYMGVNPMTRQWHRQSVYGGLLVENIVQAISRDVMAEAMTRLEDTNLYKPILTVHDEVIAEAHKDHGNVEEFVALVGQTPLWAKGCPISAEGWAGTRYRK